MPKPTRTIRYRRGEVQQIDHEPMTRHVSGASIPQAIAEQATAWWMDYANIITLTSYMADHDYDVSEVARAVEKPWSYEDEFRAAKEAETRGE